VKAENKNRQPFLILNRP